jgi:hypothetical protein
MNIQELDSYDLDDAVKFNDSLNPKLFGPDEKLLPQVRDQLLKIADDFREFLGIKDLQIKDITVSGSNAAYTYTDHSDIDLHLVVDLPEADASEVYRELFDAKKYAYNDQHNIKIGGYDVELYVQDANKKHHSQGIYSLVNDDWVAVPRRRRPDVDDISVKAKFEDLGHRIEDAIASGDYEKISALSKKIKEYRQAGLDAHGEFGAENLAFKILRTQGLIQKLIDARGSAKDQMLSLDERRRKKKSKVRYGYGGYWYPGTAYAGQDHAAGTEGGGGDGGGESIRESVDSSDEDILRNFIRFCVQELKIEHMPRVKLRKDPQWSQMHRTFGRYNDENKTLEVAWGQRHIMDVLRTVAHELTHKHQHERDGERMGPDAGETGSPYENEANARAGVLMRDYGRLHPEYFAVGQAHDLEESASGYIPTKAQAKDPRFSMALTVDIKPGQVGKEANKLKLKTDKQGHPQTARANGLFEELMLEFQLAKEGIDAPVSKTKDEEQYYRFILAKHKMGRPLTRGEQDYVKMYQIYRQEKLAEFAPSPERDDNDDVPDQLLILANRWWNATDKQPQIEHVLNSLGWSIHQVESEDDAVQLQHHDGTTHFISADEFDPDLFEISDELRRSYLGRAGQQVDRRQERMAQVRDRLNKGYEIYHADRPAGSSQIVDRFEADTPTLAQQYYERFIQGYESDVDFDLRLRRATGIMEAFNAPYPMTWEHSKDSHDALVKLPDGSNLSIMFSKEYMFGDEEDWHVEFWRNNSQEVTGEGDAQRIFATVLSAIQQFIKTENPERIRFSASKDQEADSRTNLYGSLVRRYANAWGYEVDSSEYGGSTVYNLYKLYEQDLNEDEELDEVKMSPGALEKFATSKEAQGIRAGFEAELIFRDTQGTSDDLDPEPDYDADERAYSIQQVIEFFDNDEYGYGLSDRERNRLEENLDETYMNWRDEQMISDFRNEAEDLVREVYLDETPMGERIIKVLTDGMEIDDARADQILALGVDAPKFTSSSEQAAYAEQNPDYKIYLEAADDAEVILDEEVEASIDNQDGYYDQALDEFRDNYSGDDDSFFSDVGLRWMSDIANEFNLDWPVWNMDAGGNNGSRSWDDIGTELQALVDMPVVVSDNYHSTRRRPGQWIIEPDGSLNPDDKSEEAGLEIVSPPMPLLMALDKLRAITDWANDPQGGNAYTNSSTGLHMGVSLPRIQAEDDNDRAGIDYVKLILFMGDKYVLEKFGRSANTYTASALEKFKQNIRGGRSDPAGVVELLRHGLTELAYRELQKGVGTSKYTSAHLQDGYIEFRSPGGDWLAKADEEIGVLENTMLRFARAMQIAGDPSAERQEYAKKLYKLVTEGNEQYADQLRLFSEYSAGTIDKEQLKKRWAEKTIGTEKKANQRWKLYQKYNGTWTAVPGAEWNGYTEDQVKNAVWSKYGREALDSGEYQLVNMGEQEWEVYDVKTGATLEIVKGKSKGEVADAVYDKYVDQGIGFQVRPYEDPAKMTPRAKLAKRITTKKPETKQVANQATNERGIPYWEVYEIESEHVVHTFLSDTAADARVDGANWLTSVGAEYPDLFAVRPKIKTTQVRDVEPNVAQNFEPDYSAYERNSDRIDAIRAGSQQPRQNYELVLDDDPTRVIHFMRNATADEVRAWIAQQEQEGMPPGLLRTRIVAEAIDAVSGAGAVSPRPVIKKISTDRVEPVEPVVRSQKPRSAIGQAISQQDIENMTQQIKIARRLGDDVNENFADGKVKGKSRPGRVKRAGASCNGSVTDLRKRAKNASGEKAKMYHWCANMKSGRKK